MKPTSGARVVVTEGEGIVAGLRKLEEETPFGKYAKAAQAGWAERARDDLRAKWPDRTSFAKWTSRENGQVLMTTPGSLTGWAHLSVRGRRRADWAGKRGRRWAAAGLEKKRGGRAETISWAKIK